MLALTTSPASQPPRPAHSHPYHVHVVLQQERLQVPLEVPCNVLVSIHRTVLLGEGIHWPVPRHHHPRRGIPVNRRQIPCQKLVLRGIRRKIVFRTEHHDVQWPVVEGVPIYTLWYGQLLAPDRGNGTFPT